MACNCSSKTSEGVEDNSAELCWLAWEPKTLRLCMLIMAPRLTSLNPTMHKRVYLSKQIPLQATGGSMPCAPIMGKARRVSET